MCFGYMCYFVILLSVVSASEIDCLKRLVLDMTCYVSSGTLNDTNSAEVTKY